jgi:hypothetical protein
MPPTWIHKRDGRLVPFEPDKISRSLFAATESLGRPDAFLARELTDGVVHFLGHEAEGPIPTTAQVADVVAKVVRELGHPLLAQAYAAYRTKQMLELTSAAEAAPGQDEEIALRFSRRDPPRVVLRKCLRDYTLQVVFTRDLVAAQNDGLITLSGLETPLGLAATSVERLSAAPGALLHRLLDAGSQTSSVLVLDGVEHTLATATMPDADLAAGFVRDLGAALECTQLRVVVNLNSAEAPSWANDLAEGPLFSGQRMSSDPQRQTALARALFEALRHSPLVRGQVRVDWHLGERDFAVQNRGGLQQLTRLLQEEAALAIVCDRPRSAVALAEGIDRRHPGVLMAVGLHLPQLAEQLAPNRDPNFFLRKLGSMTQLALSAAAQKREFLRRHGRDRPALGRGFLLERARLMVVPVGLEAALRLLTGHGLSELKTLDLGLQVLQRLRDVLLQGGPSYLLDACLDGPADFTIREGDGRPHLEGIPDAQVAGLTGWDRGMTVKEQLRAAGALHAVAEGGTAAVLLGDNQPTSPEQVVEWLHTAWQQTSVVRLRFVPPTRLQQHLPLP